ncbi:MAG: acetyl-CoA carboxylase [Actinomycetota bacterium]
MTEHAVRSPLPGVFYRRPSPNEPVFVEVGADVTADQTIGLVEVMKQFSEVKAGAAGRLAGFSVDNEAVIGPGDVIATIEVG